MEGGGQGKSKKISLSELWDLFFIPMEIKTYADGGSDSPNDVAGTSVPFPDYDKVRIAIVCLKNSKVEETHGLSNELLKYGYKSCICSRTKSYYFELSIQLKNKASLYEQTKPNSVSRLSFPAFYLCRSKDDYSFWWIYAGSFRFKRLVKELRFKRKLPDDG